MTVLFILAFIAVVAIFFITGNLDLSKYLTKTASNIACTVAFFAMVIMAFYAPISFLALLAIIFGVAFAIAAYQVQEEKNDYPDLPATQAV